MDVCCGFCSGRKGLNRQRHEWVCDDCLEVADDLQALLRRVAAVKAKDPTRGPSAPAGQWERKLMRRRAAAGFVSASEAYKR